MPVEDGPFTILLFEDDPNDVLLFKRALRKNNIPHPVQSVHDGAEGIRYITGEGKYADRALYPFPRVLVMDLKMPRMSGMEVLEWIQENPQYMVIPTIVLSSSKVPSDIRRAYELGVNSYIAKPGSFERLQYVIKVVCDYWDLCEKPLPAFATV